MSTPNFSELTKPKKLVAEKYDGALRLADARKRPDEEALQAQIRLVHRHRGRVRAGRADRAHLDRGPAPPRRGDRAPGPPRSWFLDLAVGFVVFFFLSCACLCLCSRGRTNLAPTAFAATGGT